MLGWSSGNSASWEGRGSGWRSRRFAESTGSMVWTGRRSQPADAAEVVLMAVDVDRVVEPAPPLTPFSIDVGLDRQGSQGGPVEFLEQLTPAHAELAHRQLRSASNVA